MSSSARERLTALSDALRPLHLRLVGITRTTYEQAHGPIPGPAALLQHLLHDPAFAWLRPLSGLMADLDALLEEAALEDEHVREVLARIKPLFADAEGHPFAGRYLELLQADIDLVADHAILRRALERL